MKFIKLAIGNKKFTEGYYEGQKDLGSPKRHKFREEFPHKRISKVNFKTYPLKTKSFIKRATSSVAWEEISNISSIK
jgi:hypothetical protein